VTEIVPFEDLDRALARSRETREPLFLYWGTKWCPPCAEMQMTVLQRPLFLARSANLIATTIDGDAPGAQLCGDRIDSEVYPTMLLLDADEREWVRMPCGLTEADFCSVIDAALRCRSPVRALADTLIHQSRPLREEELELLASHYWPQDRRTYPGTQRLTLLDRLDVATVGAQASFVPRVLVWQLVQRAAYRAIGPTTAERQTFYERFQALLDSQQATFSTLYYILVGLEPVFEYLCDSDAGRRRVLTELLLRVLDRLTMQETLTWTERLISLSAALSLDPSSLAQRTRTLVAKADAATVSATERQSVMNMAGHVVRQIGLTEESIRLFCTEIERSPWPTYFMPYVAEMYMEQGAKDEAFRWWLRSYDETSGKTTRFELGVRYIAALVRHAPKDRAQIERTVTRLIAERGEDADMPRGRMRKSLRLLARTLGDWKP